MDAARDLLRRATQNGDALVVDGEPLTVERVKSAMSVGVRGERRDGRRLHRRARPAGRRRPRHGLGADPRGRADRDRHLAARQRVVLLLRHDAHVRRRRRAGRRARVASPLRGGARPRDLRDQGRRERSRDLRRDLRDLRSGRRADAAHEDAGRAARERVLPRARSRRRARGARAARARADGEAAARRRATSSPSSRGSTGRATAASGSRTSCSSRRTAPRT